MRGRHFSLILLPTNQCNVACAYCFENKTRDRLSHEALAHLMDKVLQHMEVAGIDALTIYWQGGEVMTLRPDWMLRAHELIGEAAAARGKHVSHGLQTNLIAYSARWNRVIAEMFGNEVGTSMDFPNLHRRLANGDAEAYSTRWRRKVREAREAGIKVKVIAVVHAASLARGGEACYRHFVEELGITDFQINTPFPGGDNNTVKDELDLEEAALVRFHTDLADLWLAEGYGRGVEIGPFDQLLRWFQRRDACLPCYWGPNCTEGFVSIDARGFVGQCDCWVTSYPAYHYGNLLEAESFTALLEQSRARAEFIERPLRLVQQGCIECDYLNLCHGGCPVRAYTARGDLFQKDPYCGLYKALFQHMERHARTLAAGSVSAPHADRQGSGDLRAYRDHPSYFSGPTS
jgi:radical SAM protein with 4Fe4S-binding SPASM domain